MLRMRRCVSDIRLSMLTLLVNSVTLGHLNLLLESKIYI